MKQNNKGVQGEPKKFSISILLYVAAMIVALLGIALLVNDIIVFRSAVAQYVMQGYPADEVIKGLMPTQLLPAIFEAIALYGGMAFALLGIGIANKKLSQYITTLKTIKNDEIVEESSLNIHDEAIEESVLIDNGEVIEDIEITNEKEQKTETEEIESK